MSVPVLDGTPKIRVAEIPPAYCASCHGQYPDRRHVDFGANYEGPSFHNDNVAGGQWQSVDDLIICEDCFLEAMSRLGYEPASRVNEHVAMLERENEQLRNRMEQALGYIEQVDQEQKSRKALIEALTTKKEKQ